MKAQDLKKSILQYAMQGKLVAQDPNDEPASELLKRIKAEKERLIKEGKIKKEKPLSPITRDEIPYSLPQGWEWVRLGNLSVVNGGYAFKSSEYKNVGIRVVRISDFNESGFVNHNIVRYDYNNKLDDYLLEEKNIILCMTGGTVGKSLFIKNLEEPMVTNQRVATIKILGVIEDYINYSILSPLTQQVITESKNSTNDNISIETIKNFLIPFPPLAEQKRIVEKLEEILPLAEEYGKNEEILSEMNQKLPKQIRQSILQYAVQGKLVEQNPQDEPASELLKRIKTEKEQLIKDGKIKKEKPLPPITKDEIPYDLPQGWEWVRLQDIVYNHGQKTPQTTFCYIDIGSINNQQQKLNKNENIVLKENAPSRARKIVKYGDILYATVRPYLHNMCIIDQKFSYEPIASTGFAVLHCYSGIFNKWLFYYLLAPIFDNYANSTDNAKGMAYPAINDDKLYKALIPIPPLTEQKRIVSKVEELMQLVDKL